MRSLLARPAVYDTFQQLLGAARSDRRLAADYIQPSPGARVVDLGCGTGRILAALPADINYLGVDISPDYIRAARQRWEGRGQFVCGDLLHTDIQAGPADRVLMLGVLHHLDDDDCRTALKLAASLLTAGGRLTAVEAVHVDDPHPVARWLISRDRGAHVRTADQYRALVEPLFRSSTVTVVTDLIRLPYTHAIVQATA